MSGRPVAYVLLMCDLTTKYPIDIPPHSPRLGQPGEHAFLVIWRTMLRLSPSGRLVGGGPKMGEGTSVTRSHLSMQGVCVKGVKCLRREEGDLAHNVETLAVRSARGGWAQDGGGDNRHQVPPGHAGTMCGKCEKCGGGGLPTGPHCPHPAAPTPCLRLATPAPLAPPSRTPPPCCRAPSVPVLLAPPSPTPPPLRPKLPCPLRHLISPILLPRHLLHRLPPPPAAVAGVAFPSIPRACSAAPPPPTPSSQPGAAALTCSADLPSPMPSSQPEAAALTCSAAPPSPTPSSLSPSWRRTKAM